MWLVGRGHSVVNWKVRGGSVGVVDWKARGGGTVGVVNWKVRGRV